MADSDFNVIKPVESLQTIQGLTPMTRQQERKRRQKSKDERREEPEEKHDETAEPQARTIDDDPHCIDYCA
ncbi:MAG: hypothetical protein JW993_03070 [Sedimentisphaerales bacterium]|nr:hypothetical protein [Sedimentisphaerales bacterium]